MHIAADGCFRVSRIDKGNAGNNSKSATIQDRIVKKEVVEEALKQYAIDFPKAKENKNKNEHCESNFVAAGESGSGASPFSLDERGLFGLCCRHGTILSLCDLLTGERFAYLDLLIEPILKKLPEKGQLYLYYDIMCRYQSHMKVHIFVNIRIIKIFSQKQYHIALQLL